MTPEEIQAMEQGQELDELVITHVLGMKVVNHDEVTFEWVDDPANYPYVSRESLSQGRLIKWILPDEGGYVFCPSTDISAAWEVVETMMERYIYIKIDTYHQNYIVKAIKQTSQLGDCKVLSEVESESAPYAICRAALLAVLGEEEE